MTLKEIENMEFRCKMMFVEKNGAKYPLASIDFETGECETVNGFKVQLSTIASFENIDGTPITYRS